MGLSVPARSATVYEGSRSSWYKVRRTFSSKAPIAWSASAPDLSTAGNIRSGRRKTLMASPSHATAQGCVLWADGARPAASRRWARSKSISGRPLVHAERVERTHAQRLGLGATRLVVGGDPGDRETAVSSPAEGADELGVEGTTDAQPLVLLADGEQDHHGGVRRRSLEQAERRRMEEPPVHLAEQAVEVRDGERDADRDALDLGQE